MVVDGEGCYSLTLCNNTCKNRYKEIEGKKKRETKSSSWPCLGPTALGKRRQELSGSVWCAASGGRLVCGDYFFLFQNPRWPL